MASPPTFTLVAGDDAYAVVDVRAAAGSVLPPHVASLQDGALVVLEGAIEVICDDGPRHVGPGELVALPRARPRRIAVVADTRVLCLSVPAGLERLTGLVGDPALDPDDLAANLAAAGVDLLPATWGAPTG